MKLSVIHMFCIVIFSLVVSSGLFADSTKALSKLLPDGTTTFTEWKSRALKAEKQLKETKIKLFKAIKYLEEYVNSTPEVIEFKPRSIKIKLVDLTYSITMPAPSYSSSWLKNLNVSLGWTSSRLQDLDNFNFANSRVSLNIGYTIYGMQIFTSYDFVNNWNFGLKINLVEIGSYIFDKAKDKKKKISYLSF